MLVANNEGFVALNQMLVAATNVKWIKAVELMADIDMTGKTWTAVDVHTDLGIKIQKFNGNGHTISNMTIAGQAMFKRVALGAGVNFEMSNITFDKATVNSKTLNTAVVIGQTYNNTLFDNVDVKNSTVTGAYKVAPFIATVYDENTTAITATLKNCDAENTKVTCTSYDFCTAGMVAFVYESNNDHVAFENCSVKNVELYAKPNGYTSHAAVYVNDADTDDCFNEVTGVTVENVTFTAI